MGSGTILLIGKTVLWFAIPLVIAVWDLRNLRRDKARTAAEEAAQSGSEGSTSRSR